MSACKLPGLGLLWVLVCLQLASNSQSRTVLVTGATKGIGAAISSRFASAGDQVILHWRTDAAEAEAVCASLPPPPVGSHICVRADLATRGSSSALVQQVIREVGRIDVLVCNHGIHEETPIEMTSAEEFANSFDRVMRTNLHAPAELVRPCLSACVAGDGAQRQMLASMLSWLDGCGGLC
jgi:NAD(P)-dependent dehydrogenase (short-subunit alcohol dehydrogenase family)